MDHKISGAEEIINRIADEVSKTVERLGEDQECEICKEAFTNYNGSCQGYSWHLYYGKGGYWEFILYLHTKEIWHFNVMEGLICDVLLGAIKGLSSGKWKSNIKQ